MTEQKTGAPAPTPIPITGITVVDPATGETVIAKGSGTLTFTNTPIFTPALTIIVGLTQGSGLKPAIPYTVYFNEGDYRMQIMLLVFVPLQPNPPYAPPYNFTWVTPLPGGVPVTKVSVFDNIAEDYVIKDAAGTFFQSGGSAGYYFMTLMQLDTSSGSVVGGGPVPFRNCTISYSEKNPASGKEYQLTLSKLLFQGQLSGTVFVFQQIGAGQPPRSANQPRPSDQGGESRDGGITPPPETQPNQEE